MAIITFTSDLGSNSHYPALVKGVMLSRSPDTLIVDVTHAIASFDIMEAAYVVKHMFKTFPPGTIHLVAVDPYVNEEAEGVVVAYQDHFFIGPNNGLLYLIGGNSSCCVSIVNAEVIAEEFPRSFRAARLYGPAAAFLANGGAMENLGEEKVLRDLHWGAPSYTGNCLRGKIIHIDKFGNAITNIRKEEFLELKDGRRFEIFIRNVRLKRIVNTYADVGKADALAIFGGSKHLEIAMREASAAELLGLKVHDMITIEFSK
ncbi:MAG: SAM-dependent chlorinase/fluorinase [Bacteroidota bacterium]